MAQALVDIAHFWGQDLQLGPTGDLATVSAGQRSEQHVLRRLMTNREGYVFHPDYGAGLPQKVGQLIELPKIRALIQGQMLLEASVLRSPAPKVDVRAIQGGVAVEVQYTSAGDKQPVSLSFNVSR